MKFLKVKEIRAGEEFYLNLEKIEYFAILNLYRGTEYSPGLVCVSGDILDEKSSVNFLDIVKNYIEKS